MKMACLGWGSLVWDPRSLPVRRPWFNDGPLLPIEFARHSKGERITLVIVPDKPDVAYVRSLWALMSIDDLKTAKEELAEREGKIGIENIGHWSKDNNSGHRYVEIIKEWAIQKNLEAVIWTALPPKFDKIEGKVPTVEEILSFLKLKNLPYEKRKFAEEYIRKAPLQIDTDYRRKIDNEFNWPPLTSY